MPQGPKDYLKLGDWNAQCDGCNFKYKFSELSKDWKGLMKCQGCWEPRNVADFIKPPRITQPLPEVRPDKDLTEAGLPTVVANSFPISTLVASTALDGNVLPTGTFTLNNRTL